jgi:hypothetical protein
MSKRIAVPLVVVAAVTLTAGAALAAWTASSSGTGSSKARSLGTGATPTASASGSTVTVTFAQTSLGSSLLGSLTGGAYSVKRYSGTTLQTTTSCTGSAAPLSCNEANVAVGTWTYKVTPTLSGWTGTESQGVNVTVIAAPTGLALTAATDSGTSQTDRITNVTTPVVPGSAAAGSTVTIFDGSTQVGSGTAAGGTFSITLSTLAQGTHTITATATSGSGTSGPSNALSVTIDTTAPQGLAVSGSGLSGHHAQLSGQAGSASGDAASVFVVVCATNSFPCASPQASSTRTVTNGTWSWPDTNSNLGNTTHYAQVTQTDTAGNSASKISAQFTT